MGQLPTRFAERISTGIFEVREGLCYYTWAFNYNQLFSHKVVELARPSQILRCHFESPV